MHDTILLQKITDELERLCENNKIEKVKKVSITVNEHSHVNRENLYEHLVEMNQNFFGPWTEIIINKQDIKEQTAILESIEGEVLEL
ncbi:hypothetical protein [Anaeromicropila herbilytica]|uniref:Hydrogenase maturation nickel metallochaperone HypA n=1 Tax=Anaeromicropila herbilytica TaxID=2785025 RepID=A0A7R7EMB8_9FIRM|nr:hypothetical protein [Anaeromicropila herbilytica]BCN31246.1 hypothetical protein bsdtb5_25410 [Anaeromicropila herbilytica]